RDQITAAIETCKSSLVCALSGCLTDSVDSTLLDLRRAIALTKAISEAGEYLMTGSDYLDSLASGYSASLDTLSGHQALELSRTLTENPYDGLRSLTIDDPPHSSLRLDHLYSLKEIAYRTIKANH